MGKVDNFVVQFYGGKRTFYPGEAINGTLRLKVNKELKLRGLRIEFHGKAFVHWGETRGSGESSSTRHYINSQTYIDTLATLIGKGQFGFYSFCYWTWRLSLLLVEYSYVSARCLKPDRCYENGCQIYKPLKGFTFLVCFRSNLD